MEMGDPSTIVTLVQTLAVALLVFFGQYVVAKMSNKAHTKTTDVDAQSKATNAWQEYAAEMKTRVDGLDSRLTAAEQRVRALEIQSAHDLDLIRRLVYRYRKALVILLSHGVAEPPEDTELLDIAELRLNRDDSTV